MSQEGAQTAGHLKEGFKPGAKILALWAFLKKHLWIVGSISIVAGVLIFGMQALIFPQQQAHEAFLGETLPNYAISSGSGQELSLHELVEQYESKSVLMSFWATWCEPCIRELPMLVRALPQLEKQDTGVLLINYDGGLPERTRREVEAWLISEGLPFTSYYDFESSLLSHLHVVGLPFSMRVDRDTKKITWMKMGELEKQDLLLSP